MGCGISKQARPRARSRVLRDSKLIASLPRSYSLSAHAKHAVSLKSTTFGSMKLDSLDPKIMNHEEEEEENEEEEEDDDDDDDEKMPLHNTSERREVLVQAKAWSNDVQGKMKICRTPLLRTPPNDYEPETINAWELMDGLEDSSPLPLPRYLETPKQIWADDAEEEEEEDLAAADFDPEILSQFRKALDELSPPNSRRVRSPEPPPPERSLSVRDRIRAFQERIDGKKAPPPPPPPPPCGEESQSQNLHRVVIYFTSLRGVRKTYEDCCNVRTIFRSGYGVRADERDVSMHHGFRQELCGLMGTHSFGGLPRVFVKGSYVGGAEEIRRMHESGELEKLIQGCKKFEQGPGGVVAAADAAAADAAACQGCGDVRFVPCDRCFGSCKLFDEDQGLFLRCPDCNENGIVCCPLCFT